MTPISTPHERKVSTTEKVSGRNAKSAPSSLRTMGASFGALIFLKVKSGRPTGSLSNRSDRLRPLVKVHRVSSPSKATSLYLSCIRGGKEESTAQQHYTSRRAPCEV